MTVLEEILSIKNQTLADISKAAKSSDEVQVTRLSLRLERLVSLSKKAAAVAEKLSLIKAEMGEPGPAGTGHTLRLIGIVVTGGMLRRHMLIVTPYKDQIAYGEEMQITTADGKYSETFETEFVKTGNRLRARGQIGAFYKRNKVKEGDTVVLFETAAGQWRLETKEEFDTLNAEAATVEPEPAQVPESPSPKATKSPPAPVKAGTPISEI